MEIPFFKLEANGNNYLLIQEECINKNLNINHLVTRITNKNYGIGSDGVLVLSKNYRPIPYIEIYNSDGSKANLCINGLRIVAKFLFDTKYTDKEKIKIKTYSGIYEVVNSLYNIIVKIKILNTINKKEYNFHHKKYLLHFLNLGNNHAYIINKGKFNEKYFRRTLGKQISKEFDCNVGLVKPINPYFFSIITYERGSNLTMSCGSNICGATFLLKEQGLIKENKNIDVETLGGNLTVNIKENEVNYIGNTNLICKGLYYL